MEKTSPPFAASHPWDHAFYLIWTTIAWISLLMGFGPLFLSHLAGKTPFLPWIVHVHAAVFFGWMILFTVQIWLIKSKRAALHMRLGMTAAGLVPVMVVLGLITNYVMRRYHFAAGVEEANFTIVIFMDLLLFGVLAWFGLAQRKSPATHKRLMLMTTAVLLPVGFARWIGPMFPFLWGGTAQHASVYDTVRTGWVCYDLMIVALIVYDVVTRRRIHPVFLPGFAFVLVSQIITNQIFWWPAWLPIAKWLNGI